MRHRLLFRILATLTVFSLSLLILLGSSVCLPMVWDEGNAIRRSGQMLQWFSNGPTLSHDAIQQGWPYTTQVEGHPAFYGLVIAAGRAVSSSFLSPLTAARFGPICLFALAVAAVFWRVSQWKVSGAACPRVLEQTDFNPFVAALGAVGAIFLLPRLFAHAHFASFDGPLTACWLIAWALFNPFNGRMEFDAFEPAPKASNSIRPLNKLHPLLFGIALGMTLSCKATGWIAPVPFIVWTLCYRDRQAAKCLALGLPIALLTFFVLNPPLWLSPIDGFSTFLRMNFHREALGLNLSTQFLGQLYNLDHPLPWYNTLFWVGVTVPVSLLILLVVELVAIFRRPGKARLEMLVAMNAAVLLIVRALPGVPVHDGVRLFLPAFAFIAILIGFGAARLWRIFRTARLRWIGPACVVTLYLCAASSLLWFAPNWLSYYNLLIGGPSGAAAVGMEPTYYWDSLDDEVLDWLNKNTGHDEKVLFVGAPTENLILLRRWGKLTPDFSTSAPGHYRWRVIQNRPGGLQPDDLRRLREETPVYRKTLVTWGGDILLLGIYPIPDE